MNLISILIGLVNAVIMFVGFVPLLGWLNWISVFGAAVGAIVGAFSKKKTGLVINVVVIVVGALRLIVGGGFV